MVVTEDSLEDLLDDLETHGDLDRADSQLSIRVEKRRYSKPMTIIEGFQNEDVDALASELKAAVGAGGTTSDDTIEIQGDHRDRVPALLRDRGYAVA